MSAKPKTNVSAPANANQPGKDLYEIGEIPPLGHVPAKMYAWTIRQERHGPPDSAMSISLPGRPGNMPEPSSSFSSAPC